MLRRPLTRADILGVYTGLRLYLDNTNRSSLGVGLGAVQEIPVLRAQGREAEAQRIALAQSIGEIHLALRATGDESRVPLQTVSAIESFGMRGPPKQSASNDAAPSGAARAAAPAPRPMSGGTEVRIVRGIETSVYQVPK